MSKAVGGIIYVKVDGATQLAKGAFTYDLGSPKRDSVMGSDGFHGFKEVPKPAYLDGEVTDQMGMDVKAFFAITDSTVTCELANGKTVVFRNAFYAGDGTVGTEEGAIKVRFEAPSGEEI